jgi:hypothetical protein
MLFGTRRILSLLCASACVIVVSQNTAWAQSGGFMDSSTGAGLRPKLSAGEIQTFVPPRGVFTFPAPYSTTGIRLTNAGDCGGQDCVLSVGYSYWSNINNHTGSDTMLVFLGLERRRGGGGPTLFSFNKRSGETQNLGPLFSADSPYSWATGEGWYFSASQPTTLYMNDGPRMLRYDVLSHAMSEVYNVESLLGAGRVIWQMHSSNDDHVHSATVKDSGSYKELGCVAFDDRRPNLPTFIAAKGDYDECQIDKSGRYLVVKENVDGRNGEDNRIIDLQTGAETLFLDENGAAGHSDLGYGYMIAEDNFNAMPGAVRVWQLGQDLSGSDTGHIAGQGTLVYELSSWSSGIGHIAHGNAANAPSTGQMACVSNASRDSLPRVNEIVCFRLDGSMQALVVAPNMSDLNASGGGSDDYWKIPSGNIDVTGEYFIWTANMGTSRQDAFIVRIPQNKLGVSPGAPAPTAPSPVAPAPTPAPTTPAPTTPTPSAPAPTSPAPAPSPSAPSAGAATWMSLMNVAESGATLTKVGGCSGCPDGTAVSNQQVSGSGVLQFSTDDSTSLRFVGLGSGGIGTTPSDVNFAIRLQGGVAEIREFGAYKSDTRFAAGDTFTIAVNNGAVTYAKNGSVFYTSGNSATAALRGHVIFFDSNGTVRNIGFGSGGPAPAGDAPVAATPAPPTSVASFQAASSPNRLSSRALENAERLDKLP